MATAILMPKLGNTVESSVIVAWKKAVGDPIVESLAPRMLMTRENAIAQIENSDIYTPYSGQMSL